MSQCHLEKQHCMNVWWQLCTGVGILGICTGNIKTSQVLICSDSDPTSAQDENTYTLTLTPKICRYSDISIEYIQILLHCSNEKNVSEILCHTMRVWREINQVSFKAGQTNKLTKACISLIHTNSINSLMKRGCFPLLVHRGCHTLEVYFLRMGNTTVLLLKY